jgi:hypothetical protein
MQQLQPRLLPVTYFSQLGVGVRWRRKTRRKDAPPTAAHLERLRSARLLQEAQALTRELHEIRRENHFAESLRALIEGDQ